MQLNHLRRAVGIAATVLVLAASLTACGDDGASSNGGDGGASDAQAQTFGEGCADLPADGAGSFDSMVGEPVATAVSNNPLLTTLVRAVGSVEGLADTLNGAEALTVFAPYDAAFAGIPPKELNALVEGGRADGRNSSLYKLLAHHILGANADADAVVGERETLAGDTLTIAGDEDGMTVSDGAVIATVLCGNVRTANATVYVIDKVLIGVR